MSTERPPTSTRKRGRPRAAAPTLRKCRVCRRVLPAEDFYPSASRPGGITYECKQCNSRLVRRAQMVRRLKEQGVEAFEAEIARKEDVLLVAKEVLQEYQEAHT